LFTFLKFNVQKVQLRQVEVALPFRNIVERSLKIQKAEELESSIRSATYALREATEKVNELRAGNCLSLPSATAFARTWNGPKK
jgi:hypothetical protein